MRSPVLCCCVLFFLLAGMATVSRCASDAAEDSVVFCTISDNTSITTNCTVLARRQSLVLNCSQFPDALWYKENSSNSLCSDSMCTLSKDDVGYLETSGRYYCAVRPGQKHYVNIEVLGAPEYVKPNHYCKAYCVYPFVTVVVGQSPPINISVKVAGVGPFNVSWRFNSIDTVDACPPGNRNSSVRCFEVQLSNTEWIFSYVIYAPFNKRSDEMHMYSIVSNEYGQNISETTYQVQCKDPPDAELSPTQSKIVSVTEGQSAVLSCSMKSDQITSLGICYFSQDLNISYVLENTELFHNNCFLCSPNDNGLCWFQLEDKPDWVASRQVLLDEHGCNTTRQLTLQLTSLEMSDSFRFQCFYRENVENKKQPFRYWYQLSVQGDPLFAKLPWMAAIVAVVLVMLVVVMVTVLSYFWRRRRKKREERIEKLLSFSQDTQDSGISGMCDSVSHVSINVEGTLPINTTDYGTMSISAIGGFHLDPQRNSRMQKI